MTKKPSFLTNLLANFSVTVFSLATMLGLGFSSIKMFTLLKSNVADITNYTWTNTLIINCIIDGLLILILSVILFVHALERDCEEQVQATLKVVSILSVAVFITTTYFGCTSFSESMSLLYNLSISCMGVFLAISAFASISLAFMQKRVISKLNNWKSKVVHFFNSKKEKKEKIKNSTYLKESTLKTEEEIAKSKVEEIQSMFKRVKSHLSTDEVYFKTDNQMNEYIYSLEKAITEIMKNTKNETHLADIKSLMFKSLPEIALAYKDIANEGTMNQQYEHKQLVLNTLKDINQYFANILEKSREENVQEKTSELSVKLEFAKKRFLTNQE